MRGRTALAGGGWVVTWESSGQDGSDAGIYQQAYSADGSALGGEIQVNATTAGDQSLPAVALGAAGALAAQRAEVDGRGRARMHNVSEGTGRSRGAHHCRDASLQGRPPRDIP